MTVSKSLPAFHKPQPLHWGRVRYEVFVVLVILLYICGCVGVCVRRMNVAIIISSQNSSQYLSGKTQHVGKL